MARKTTAMTRTLPDCEGFVGSHNATDADTKYTNFSIADQAREYQSKEFKEAMAEMRRTLSETAK